MDDEEYWEDNYITNVEWKRPRKGNDIVQILIHEMGHILGLDHSSNTQSVMTPTLERWFVNDPYKLHSEDISRIKALYGKEQLIL